MKSAPAAIAISLTILVIGIIASTAIGAVHVPASHVIAVLFGKGTAMERSIVIDLRLPRVLLAALAGGALALSGAVFQAMLRNPLADPYVLGISSGAALGAVISMLLTGGSSLFVPPAALLGSLFAIVIVFAIALRAQRPVDARVLLLAGVIVSAFLQAVVFLLLTLLNAESFRSAIFWMLGSFATANWRSVGLLAVYVLPAAVVLIALARPLNILMSGEESALYLGVRVETVTRIAYFVASVLVGASVAACGVVGFVGLVVPHAVRLAFGSDYRLVLPSSVLIGGTFLMLSDTIARTIAAPVELPVGVITALIGVPVFVILLVRRPA